MTDPQSVLVLSNEDKIESPSTVEEVARVFFRGPEALKAVEDTDGQTHFVNVRHVVEVRPPRGSRVDFPD